MTKIGVYGGTFDPIHHGHLILARSAREELGLDRVIFVPAAESPFKPDYHGASAADRLAMVQLATAGEPGFCVDSVEVDRGGVSYSIETMTYLSKRYTGNAWYFLVGEDNAYLLNKWYRYEELSRMVTFVVLSRIEDSPELDFHVIHRRLDISSTEIRNRVANDLPITYLVPEAVVNYIAQHQLYRG
jgi:nicotinate-nucleotide adenylyltransferase